MFIGHLAVGFASKRAAPRASLGVLMAAPILLDLVWPILVLAGVEVVRVDPGNTAFTPLDFVSYPWSHSLLLTFVWASIFAGAYLGATGYRRGAAVVFAGVVSHWVLDLVTHRPDLPLWPGGPKVGLGLWSSPAATIAVEVPLYALGVALYLATTRARDRAGAVALWAFVLFALATYAGNILGPPPPSGQAVAALDLFQFLWIPWCVYIDRHREPRLAAAMAT
jgi:hypothetical protein